MIHRGIQAWIIYPENGRVTREKIIWSISCIGHHRFCQSLRIAYFGKNWQFSQYVYSIVITLCYNYIFNHIHKYFVFHYMNDFFKYTLSNGSCFPISSNKSSTSSSIVYNICHACTHSSSFPKPKFKSLR